MKKLSLISPITVIVLGLSNSHSAEIVKPHLGGYKPAPLHVHEEAATRLKHVPLKMVSPTATPDRAHISELTNISKWPSTLVYDQGNLGSCTANSAAFATCFMSIANSKAPNNLVNNPEMLRISRLYQYYNTRYHENTLGRRTFDPTDDTGASIVGSVLALDIYGCCPEQDNTIVENINTLDLSGKFIYKGLPYDTSAFSKQPEPFNYVAAFDKNKDGLNFGTPFANSNLGTNPYARISKALQYRDLASPFRKSSDNIQNSDKEKDAFTCAIINSLKNNHPVMAGVMLDDSFMNGKKGYIPTPILSTFRATGGHAIPIVGYGPYNKKQPNKAYFKFLNSWGSNWGDNGFGYFEEAYFSNVNTFSIEAYEVWLDPSVK